MQQRRRNRRLVEVHIRKDISHIQRMNDVLLAGRALLSLVRFPRQLIGVGDQIHICARLRVFDLGNYIVYRYRFWLRHRVHPVVYCL